MKKYSRMYHISDSFVSPVIVRQTTQQGRTIWRGEFGTTYSARQIKAWDELTAEQKTKAYQSACDYKIDSAKWTAAKDPELSESAENWIAEAITERDEAIRAIMNCENVPPPTAQQDEYED